MNNDYTPTERAFVLGLQMATDRRIDNSQLAAFGLSPSGAYRLMIRLARVAPIVRGAGGDWRLLRNAHTRETPLPETGMPGVDE